MAKTIGIMLATLVRNAYAAATQLTVAVLALILPAAAHAQSYPSKPLRLVLGLPAGGGADAIARIIASKLSDNVAQPVVVENRPGSAARIAAETVARSSADGYTLLFGGLSNAIAASLYKTLPYDAERDFAPVSMLATLPSVLVVNLALPTKSVSEFVAYAKAHPGKMSYASTGAGGALHLSMEMLKSMTGIDVVHVPYKGGVQAIPDLLSGQIQVMFEILPTQLPYLKAGKTRALAVTTGKRSAFLPDVPTMIEAGVAGFEVTIWYALYVPAAAPAPVIAKLNGDVVKTLAAREVRERLAQQGADPMATSPDQLAAFQKSEIAKWAKVIKESGVTAE
jgi:tripartite-type tricarboxylate transporter receptor subunit TctC